MLATPLFLLSAAILPQFPSTFAKPVAVTELGYQGSAELRALVGHDNRSATALDNAAIPASTFLATDNPYFLDQTDSALQSINIGAPAIDLDVPTRTNAFGTRAGGPVLQDAATESGVRSSKRGPYVGFELGGSRHADSEFSALFQGNTEVSFDTGFTLGAAFGYQITDNFRLETNLGYRKSDVDKITLLTAPGVIDTLDGSGDMSTLALLANTYYHFDLGGPITAYVGFGIGLGIVDVDTRDTSRFISVDDSAATLAWNLMVGVSYGALDNVDLDLGYRYLGAIDPELTATYKQIGNIFPGGETTVNVDVELHEIFLSMRYAF